ALFRQHGSEAPHIDMPNDYAIFAPRCICVLSNVPFYRAMTRYLRQLYSISISMTPVPIEKFVASVISQVMLLLSRRLMKMLGALIELLCAVATVSGADSAPGW